MPLYEVLITEVNEGCAYIEAEDSEEAEEFLFENFDLVDWVTSEIAELEVNKLERRDNVS